MKIPLRKKYTDKKQSGGGKSAAGTSTPTKKKGLAALMENERARELHFMECATHGWWEQIPQGLRASYKKRATIAALDNIAVAR